MVTVAEVLKLEEFRGAQVLSGEARLDHPISWVHNAGVPDAARWLNGGELVLTTIVNLPQAVEERCDYVREMAAKDVAALVITIGRYIEAVPDYLIETAQASELVLISIPYTARFVDIARRVNEAISHDTMHMVRRALNMNQVLTQIVLQGGGLDELAQRLAELVAHSISIETERFDAIATFNVGGVDEARRYTQQEGRTDPRLVDALEKRGYLPRIRETLRPVQLPPMPDVGLEMERLLAPIVVHGAIYGYMWIIADTHSLSEIDLMAIEIGATIAALMMLYQESVQSAEASLKGSLLAQLIQGDATRDAVLTDQALRYGVDLRADYALLLLDCEDLSAGRIQQIYRGLQRLLQGERWPAIISNFAGQIVLLAQASSDLDTLAQRAIEQARQERGRAECRPRIAISEAQQGAQGVRQAYQHCVDALRIARRLDPQQVIVHFARLGYLHTLYQAGPQSLHGNPSAPLLRRLLEERQADLFHTLETYLDEGGNGVSTAEALHIHRSTLNYRLTRIMQICELDLQEPQTRTNLQIALKLMRLFELDETGD